MNNNTYKSEETNFNKSNKKSSNLEIMIMQPAMVNPYASAAKTAEIMSRYRPIAPKPMDGGGGDGAAVHGGGGDHGGGGSSDGMSEKIQQSPYLRNMWPKLQARPTRTRKGGRMIGVSVSPVPFKRTSPPQRSTAAALLGLPSRHYYGWFGGGFFAAGAVEKIVSGSAAPVTLPLLPSSPASSSSPERNVEQIDLKSMVEMTPEEEKNLTLQLRGPECSAPASGSGSVNVISPRPVRPVGSCITVNSLTPVILNAATTNDHLKTPKEAVEAEIEADEVPAIVTDSRNRVRLTNSAYNAMVGQPKCMWPGARIGGEVGIKFNTTTGTALNMMDHGVAGFKGWAKIEWGSKTKETRNNKTAVDASCNVERQSCACNDYAFAWRFRAV